MVTYTDVQSGRLEEAIIKVELGLFERMVELGDVPVPCHTVDGCLLEGPGDVFEYFATPAIRDVIYDALVLWWNTAYKRDRIVFDDESSEE